MIKERVACGTVRAKEFMDLYRDENVKAIIFLSGGDFACELLEYLNFDEISKLPAKWIMGYSDCTNLVLTFTTLSDTASIYGPTFKIFGMRKWDKSLFDSFRIMENEEFSQNSYEKCETLDAHELIKKNGEDPYYEYNLVNDVKWLNLKGENEVHFKGRCVGGCIDILREAIIGSKFDKLKQYCDKYKSDGIVWFLEDFEGNTPEHFRTLWRMKSMGLFENCKGIIFGRPLMVREDYEISYNEATFEVLKDFNFPVVMDVDIGHLPPQIPIVSGSILEVYSKDGKGYMKSIFN